jgi:hypothetical protein
MILVPRPHPTAVNAPVLVSAVFIVAMSILREPDRRRLNALLIAGAGAGAVYFGAGFGWWEVAFGGLFTWSRRRHPAFERDCAILLPSVRSATAGTALTFIGRQDHPCTMQYGQGDPPCEISSTDS